MPAIQPYTAESFKEFLHTALSHTAGGLNWSVDGGDYDEILTDTLIALDAADIASFTSNADLKKVRSVGKYFLWQAVASATAGDYNFSADGGSYSREQAHAHALAMLAQAESLAMQYGVVENYAVTTATATYHRDPYRDYNDDLATEIDTEF